MSDHLAAEAPADAPPYPSLEELKAEHSTLLRRRRGGFVDNPAAFLGEVETFLKRGHAMGRILGDEAERYSAQSLLTYWSNVLYRKGRQVPEDALAEYDPGQAPELADTECPYVGLGQQQEGDQPLRSPGWSRLIDESLKVIEKERFLAIVGANGSGRHPLIHGGILPALRNGAIQGSENWRILPSLVPGADPLSELLRHLHPEADTTWIEQQLAALRAEPARLAGWSDDGNQRPTVLVIERFGELFEQSDRTQIQPFAEALLALAHDPDTRHIIILGTRPDNLSLISAIGGFGKLFQRNQVLMSFTNRELRQMVEEPAKRVGLKYDDGVVDRLLLDVQGDPAALTLLQFNLLLLWKHRQGNRVTHEIYDGIGGGRLAVARQAERVYSSLSPEQQKAVKLAFLKLVRVESGTRVILQRVPRRQLVFPEVSSGVMNAALDRLIDGQILVSREGPGSGESSLRLVHEAAATAWPRCVEWLDEFRARHRWQLGLRTAAEQWRDKGKDCGALWRGGALEQAGDERARFLAEGGVLSPLEEQFLDASQKAEKRGIWLKRGLITLAIAGSLLIAMLWYLLALQEKRSRQELGMAMSHRSTAEAIRLERWQGDSTGSFLWLCDAWKRLQDNGTYLERQSLQSDYRLRLGLALRGLPRIARVLYHKDPVTSLVASAVSDDRRFATKVGEDGTVFHWPIAEGTADEWPLRKGPGETLKNHRVSMSPDGSYVVVCAIVSGDPGQAIVRKAFVRDIAAKKDIFLAYDRPVTMAEFCPLPREPLLATVGESASHKGEIRLWKVGTWEPVSAEALEAPGIIKHIAVSVTQNGSRLAAAGRSETDGSGFCREWDLTQPGKPPKDYSLVAGERRARSANYSAYSADGKKFAVACGQDGEVQCYTFLFNVTETGTLPEKFLPHGRVVNHVSFSRDGERLVTSSDDGTARVFVLGQGPGQSEPKLLRHNSSVFAADFSPDGQYVATASRDRRARVWDAETGEPVSAALQHSGSVVDAKFTRDGRQVITSSPDMVHVWDFASGAVLPFQFAVSSTIDHVCCDPKTLRVAAAGYQPGRQKGWARVWDGKDGKQITPELPHPERVTRCALSPNGGPFLATVCDDSSLRVWNTSSGEQTCEPIRFSTDQLRFVSFSHDGAWLVAAGGNRVACRGVATVYSVSRDGKLTPEKLELKHKAPITIAVFNRRGDRIITATGDSEADRGEAKIWDLSGNCTPLADSEDKEGPAHPQGIMSAAFSSDGERVVTTSFDDTARVWKVNGGTLVQELKRHTADVVSASFSDSGELVATSSKDQDAIVWKLGSKEPVAVLSHENPVNHAVFTRDSRYLVTACRDGAARIWAISGGGLVAIRKQSGTVLEVGYTGGDRATTIGIFSLSSPAQRGAIQRLPEVTQQGPTSLEYRIGVGVWDISPGVESPVESLLKIVEAIAARRTTISGGEPKLETISRSELNQAWKESQAQMGALLGPTVGPEEWHDRMAGVFEAKRRWTAAIWHLGRLIEIRPDLISAWERRARALVELSSQLDREPKKERLDQAINDITQALKMDPNNGRACVERARIHLDREEWDKADEYFSKAMKLIHGEKEIWRGRAKARARQNHSEEAISDYQEALRLAPEDGLLHGEVAEAYFNFKNWQKAADEYEQAVKRLPYNLELREHLAATLVKLGKSPQAIQEYLAVARQYKAQGHLKEAKAAYTKAIALKPQEDLGRLHAELAETCSRLRLLDETIKEYGEAVKLEPSEWTHWRGLAMAHQAKREWTEANLAYSKAIELRPDDTNLVQARAWVHNQLKEWDLAAQDYKAAVKLAPNNALLGMALAGAYLEAGKLDEASWCLKQMAEANPNNELAEIRLATVQLLRGDHGSYQAACQRLLDRFEQVNLARTANNAAWACALAPNAVKKIDRAVRLAQRAVDLAPGNADYLDTLGAVHYRANDMEGTIRLLGQSASLSVSSNAPRTSLTTAFDRLFLAMAHYRLGHVEEASELLELVVQQLDAGGQNGMGSAGVLLSDPWQKRELNLLRDEAEKLIKTKR
jgi:WD40 repeat protein/tetratricopeptide (TPR) repeat protein